MLQEIDDFLVLSCVCACRALRSSSPEVQQYRNVGLAAAGHSEARPSAAFVVVGGLTSKFMPAPTRVRHHGTSELQYAVPGVGSSQCDVQGPAPLSQQVQGFCALWSKRGSNELKRESLVWGKLPVVVVSVSARSSRKGLGPKADRHVESGWTMAREGRDGGFRPGRLWLECSRAVRLASWSGLLLWPAWQAVTLWPV